MISSFLIENFRAFRRLELPRLSRVNLFVGKNTVGKTTLLEALWLYASRMRPDAIQRLLLQRQEFLGEREQNTAEAELDVTSLFHNRDLRESTPAPLRLGPLDVPDKQLCVKTTWLERVTTSVGTGSEGAMGVNIQEVAEEELSTAEGPVFPALSVVLGDGPPQYVRLDGEAFRLLRPSRFRRLEGLPPFLRAAEVDQDVVARWWDAIALKEDSEERVLAFLRMLAPVERLTLIESPQTYQSRFQASQSRIFVARLARAKTPQPLKTLGEGVERVFRTALALEYAGRSATGGPEQLPLPGLFPESIPQDVLFIDEFELGVHYSAIAEYWRKVFAIARDFSLQVFATTHSLDCLRGFAEVIQEEDANDGLVIRLEKVEGEELTGAVIIDREGLPIVVRDAIEVR